MKDSFADALGSRFWATDPDGSAVEFFRLSLPFSSGTAAEARLVARASRLSTFSHPGFAPIRRIERVPGAADQLAIVSTAVPGVRLSDLLRRGAEKGITPSPGVVRNLGRQIVRAMADFHRAFPDLAHGALGPERVVVGPDGRAVIVEYVLAPALELLGMNRVAFWRTFRIAVPPSAGAVRFDQVTDVVQLGMVMLALVLGRPIGRDEYPCEESSHPSRTAPRRLSNSSLLDRRPCGRGCCARASPKSGRRSARRSRPPPPSKRSSRTSLATSRCHRQWSPTSSPSSRTPAVPRRCCPRHAIRCSISVLGEHP